IAEAFPAREEDRRELTHAEASSDVEPEHEWRAERGPQAEPVAAPGAFGLLALEPARADIAEDRALDPREPDLAEGEGHRQAVQDRESPFLVHEPEPGPGERESRVA